MYVCVWVCVLKIALFLFLFKCLFEKWQWCLLVPSEMWSELKNIHELLSLGSSVWLHWTGLWTKPHATTLPVIQTGIGRGSVYYQSLLTVKNTLRLTCCSTVTYLKEQSRTAVWMAFYLKQNCLICLFMNGSQLHPWDAETSTSVVYCGGEWASRQLPKCLFTT